MRAAMRPPLGGLIVAHEARPDQPTASLDVARAAPLVAQVTDGQLIDKVKIGARRCCCAWQVGLAR